MKVMWILATLILGNEVARNSLTSAVVTPLQQRTSDRAEESLRINNGVKADESFNWNARIYGIRDGGEFSIFMGILVANNAILTTANSIRDCDLKYKVVLGLRDASLAHEEGRVETEVPKCNVLVHPKFNWKWGAYGGHNVAIMHLEIEVPSSLWIGIAPLPNDDVFKCTDHDFVQDGTPAYMFGWGQAGGKVSKFLEIGLSHVISREEALKLLNDSLKKMKKRPSIHFEEFKEKLEKINKHLPCDDVIWTLSPRRRVSLSDGDVGSGLVVFKKVKEDDKLGNAVVIGVGSFTDEYLDLSAFTRIKHDGWVVNTLNLLKDEK